jgi:hypothetical protein
MLARGGITMSVAALCAFAPGSALSQVEFPRARDTVDVGKISITGYPYVFFSPETNFSLGGAVIFTSRLSPNPDVKASNAIISGYYSASHSYDIFINPEFFLGDDRYYLGLVFDYWRFVDKFWGIGNDTPDSSNVGYIRKIISANVEFDINVVGPLKVGLNYDLNYTIIEDKQTNPYLISNSVTGSDGGTSSGVGMVLFADTRNGAFTPSAGGFYKLAMVHTFPWLGSTFEFARWIADFRHYFQLGDRLVLAAQFYGSGVTGNPPFYLHPALGGDNAMRGYYEGRYRDRYYLSAQGELRAQLSERWGIVGWAGFGDVASALDNFKLRSFKPTFGFGVRFSLDPKEGLNVRADFAYGRNTNGIYFNAKEAF